MRLGNSIDDFLNCFFGFFIPGKSSDKLSEKWQKKVTIFTEVWRHTIGLRIKNIVFSVRVSL